MIQGIGIDLIEIDRIESVMKRQPRFLSRILTEAEQDLFQELPTERRKVEFLASRFAAKEAYSKAKGTGIGRAYSFQSIEILPSKKGKPFIYLNGALDENAFVSISHSKAYAVAQVVLSERRN